MSIDGDNKLVSLLHKTI